MKTSDLRAKDAAGLEKEVSELLKAHFGLRMQKATQQLTNHSQLSNTRRDIARAKTIQAEQKRAAATSAPRGQEDRSQEMNADVTTRSEAAAAAPAEPRAKNTRTLIGKVVSDKRSKTDHRADRAPHQARALRQDRRQDAASTTRTTRTASTRPATSSRSPRAGRSPRPSPGS